MANLHHGILVLDELGYIPCDGRAADILYNIISRRHAERSTIISTNLAFKQWGTVFPGAACVAALLAYTGHFRNRRVGVAITGGNIDARILSNVLLRNLLRR